MAADIFDLVMFLFGLHCQLSRMCIPKCFVCTAVTWAAFLML